MKKNIRLFFLVLIISIMYLSILDIKAALPNKLGGIEQVPGTYTEDSCGSGSCYAMPLKVYTKIDDQETTAAPIICTYYSGAVPAGKIMTKDNTGWTYEIRYGVAAVIAKALEIGNINNSQVTVDYFAAEMAINKFLNENNAKGHNVPDSSLSTKYSSKYNEYLEIARTAKNNYETAKSINMSLSTNDLTFTLNGNNYESNLITVSGANECGITSNIGTVSKTGNSFKIIVPASSITNITTINAQVSTSKTLKFASNYVVKPTEENGNSDQCTVRMGVDDQGNDIYVTKDCQSVTPVLLEEETVNTVTLNVSGTITPEPEKANITINKFDNNNKHLAGAKIKVTGPNNYVKEFTSNGNAIVINNLEYGTYVIEEIKAPDGYIVATKQTVILDKNNLNKTVTLVNNKNKVVISKIDSVSKKELPGATLEVQDEDGKIVKYCTDEKGNKNTECKWVSTDKPYEIEGLPVGKYYLIETVAPKGYVLSKEKIEFEITNDDSITEVKMENDLEVDVPNTLSSRSALLLAIAMFDIFFGISIITYVKKNKLKDN